MTTKYQNVDDQATTNNKSLHPATPSFIKFDFDEDGEYYEDDGGDGALPPLDGSAGAPLNGVRAEWFFEQAKPTSSRYESYILRTHVRLGGPLDAPGVADLGA